jgi:SnoaL-like domain
MSEKSPTPDLVESTHRLHRLLNSRDLDAVTDLFVPGSVWDASRWGLGSHEAPNSLRQFLEDWIGSFDAYELTVQEIQDLGNGIVFAVFLHAADLRGGGGSLRVRSSAVLDWEAGQLVALTSYREMDEARAGAERLAEERG